MPSTILVIEDDTEIQQFLKEMLVDNGYKVSTESDGPPALESIKKEIPDIVLLDLGLPTMKGETVVSEIRKKYKDLPIIILSARDTTNSILQGFDLGVDDYVAKPFIADELLARIKARLRHQESTESVLKVGDLELDAKALEVKRGKKQIQLTPQEFKLLQYLMSNKGRVLTREMILSRIWMYSSDVETRVVDVYMGYLRKKIDSTFPQKLLRSVRGFGYMIRDIQN